MISYEALTAGASPSNDSLLIPFTALDGLDSAAELGNSQAEDDSKISSAVLLAMDDAIRSLSNPLGIASSRPNPTGAGTNLINQNINLTWSYVLDLSNQQATVYPAAAGSSRTVAFTDVFTGAEVVTTTGSATADSIALPTADLSNYNSDITVANKQGNLGDDQRDMLEALTRLMFNEVPVRGNSQPSGVTSKNANNGNTQAAPNDFFTETTFDQSQQNNLVFVNRNYSVSHQYALDTNQGTYDLNVVTS